MLYCLFKFSIGGGQLYNEETRPFGICLQSIVYETYIFVKV